MHPPLPPQQQPQPLRVAAVTLAFRGHVRDVLVYPSLPLTELERCIVAGFGLSPGVSSSSTGVVPIAVRDPVQQVVYPLSFLTRSPELFEGATFTLLVQGDVASSLTSRDDTAAPVANGHTTNKPSTRRSRQRHAPATRPKPAAHRLVTRISQQQPPHQPQASRSSSLQLASSDDSDDSDDSDNSDNDSDDEASHSRVDQRRSASRAVATTTIANDGHATTDDAAEAGDTDDDDAWMRALDLSDFELPQLVHVFTQASPTGSLDRTTFDRCLEKILSQSGRYDPLARQMFERLFALFDANKRTGVVDVAAFLGGISALASGDRDEKIRLTFELFDADNDGFLELHEMVKYLTAFYCVVEATQPELFATKHVNAQELGAVTARQCFRESPLNAAGQLSFDAFRAWYTSPHATSLARPNDSSNYNNDVTAPTASNHAQSLAHMRATIGLLPLSASDLAARLYAAGQRRHNNSVTLTHAQLTQCIEMILAQQQRTRTHAITLFIDAVFRAFDPSHANCVDAVALASGLSILCGGSQHDRVAAAFALFDTDHDGVITPREMELYLTAVYRVLFVANADTHARVGHIDAALLAYYTTAQAFTDADRNHDGHLTFDEFRAWYSFSPTGRAFQGLQGSTVPTPATPAMPTTPTTSAPTTPRIAIGERALASIDLVASLTSLRDRDPSDVFELLAAKVNDDGVLPRDAFHAVFDALAEERAAASQCALSPTDAHKLHAILDTVFDAFDTDADDLVDFCELSSGISVFCRGSQHDKIHAAFSLFDVHEDGFIGRDELVTYFASVFRIVFTTSPSTAHAMRDVTPEQLAATTAADAFASAGLLAHSDDDDARLSLDAFTKWYTHQNVLNLDVFQPPQASTTTQPQPQPQPQPHVVSSHPHANSIARAAKPTLQEMKTLTNLRAYDVNDIFDFFQASADANGSLTQPAFYRCFNKLLAATKSSADNDSNNDTQRRTQQLLHELFALFDSDHDGAIDVQELASGLSILCGGSLDDKARSLFRLYDLNHDGFIAPDEMVAYLTGVFKVLYKASPHLQVQTSLTSSELAVATMRECFDTFDRNRDAKLSFDEFRAWLEHQHDAGSGGSAPAAGGTQPASAPAQTPPLVPAPVQTDVIPVDVATKLSGLKDIPLDRVMQLFASAADNDGRISRRAFDACFYQYLCTSAEPEEPAQQLSPDASSSVHAVIHRLFMAFDTDKNGFVDLNELASGLSVLCGGSDRDAKVQAAFDLYDTNGDGLISEDEMAHYLGSVFKLLYALDPTREQSVGISADDLARVTAAEIFAEADRNHDGRLTFDEFKKWYALPEQTSFNAVVAPLDLDEVRRLTNLGNLDVVDVFERFAECADDNGLLQRDAFDACFAAIIETASHPRSEAEKLRAKVVTDRLFDVFDQDADGQIDFSELASGLSVLCKGARDAKVKAAFRLYDFNGDGFISLDEMTRYLTSIFKVLYEVQPAMRDETGVPPEQLGAVTAEQAFLEADLNHDGHLSYDEFLTWYNAPSQAGISSVVAKSAIVDSSLRWMPLNEIKQLTNLAQFEPDEVFEIFAAEANKDGLLSRAAFNTSFCRIMDGGDSADANGVDADGDDDDDAAKRRVKDVVDGLFDLFDSDSSGYVDFGELASGLSVLCGGTKTQKVQAAFSLFDFNGDGFISLDEMTRYLTSVFRVLFQVSPDTQRVGVTPEELGQVTAEQAFAEADHDHDGRLTLDEFQRWYQQPGGIGEVAKNGEQLFSLAEARRLTNLDAFSSLEVYEALADCADDRGFVSRAAFDDCFRRIIASHQRLDAKDYEHVSAILTRLFELFDVDKNGLVDFSELSSGLSVFCGGTSEDKVRAAFALFDFNGDGVISLDEMTRYLTSVFRVLHEASPHALAQFAHESPEHLGAATAQQAFDDGDIDRDGRLTLAEFRKWYTHSSAANMERLIESSIPEWLSLREVRRLTNLGTFTPTQVLESFRQFASASGSLTATGFRNAIAQFTSPQHVDDRATSDRLRFVVDRLFALFDVDKNGVVDLTELASGLSVLCGGTPDDRVRAAFNLYDINRDGFISLGEMRLYLTSVFKVLFDVDPATEQRMGVSAEELGAVTAEQAFVEADLDHDGRLSFDEFCAWYAESSPSVDADTNSVNASAMTRHVPDWISLESVKEMTHLAKYAPDEVFELFANRCADDGTIAREAFEECFEQLIDEQFKSDEAHLARLRLILDRLFTIFDSDGNGVVDFCELSAGLSVLCGGSREAKVRAAFALYDLNQDGFISLDEMVQYLSSVFKVLYETSPGTHAKLGVPPDELAVITAEQCFLEADLNHDGKLSFDEFVRWYSRSPGFEAPAAGVGSLLAERHARIDGNNTHDTAAAAAVAVAPVVGRAATTAANGTTRSPSSAASNGRSSSRSPSRKTRPESVPPAPTSSSSASGFPASLLRQTIASSSGSDALLSPTAAASAMSSAPTSAATMDDARQLLKLDSYEVNDLIDIFAEAAPSGELSFAAFKRCFDQIIQLAGGHATLDERHAADAMVHRLFTAFDTDKSSTVDFGELASGLSVLSGSSIDDKVRAAFNLYDSNNDGYITLDEMVSYMTSIFRVMYETSDTTKAKMGVTPEELASVTASQCFKEADLNNDSRLSFDEFKKWCTSTV